MSQMFEAQIMRQLDSIAQSHRNLSIAVSTLTTVLGRLVTLQEKKQEEGELAARQAERAAAPAILQLDKLPGRGFIRTALDTEPEAPRGRSGGGSAARQASPKRKGGR